jgi:hypothetical protein
VINIDGQSYSPSDLTISQSIVFGLLFMLCAPLWVLGAILFVFAGLLFLIVGAVMPVLTIGSKLMFWREKRKLPKDIRRILGDL